MANNADSMKIFNFDIKPVINTDLFLNLYLAIRRNIEQVKKVGKLLLFY